MLKIIADEIHLTTLQGWCPPQLQIDFEQAMICALENNYPQGVMKGCLFHFAKSIHVKAN